MRRRSFWVGLALVFMFLAVFSAPVSAGAPRDDDPPVDQTPDKSLNDMIEKVQYTVDTAREGFRFPSQPGADSIGDSIWGLLGAEIQRDKPVLKVWNKDTNQEYTRYELTNGGSIGINDLGIVDIQNYEIVTEIQHKKDWDSVIKTIGLDLNLEGYKVTKAGLYSEQGTDYYIQWEKEVENIGTNPLDSVRVLIDSKTFQIWSLRRYSMEANAVKPRISEKQALKIAAAQLGGKDPKATVELTYAQPNAALGTGRPPELLFEARLAYVVKAENMRIKIDALTGEIIASTSYGSPRGQQTNWGWMYGAIFLLLASGVILAIKGYRRKKRMPQV